MEQNSVHIPLPKSLPEEWKVKFAFKKPAYMRLVGSCAVECCAKYKSAWNIDIELQMPSELFSEKDRLNYRYFYKRVYYLAVVASALKKDSKTGAWNIEFAAFQDDETRPYICMQTTQEPGKPRIDVRIFTSHAPDVFLARKLAPARNNIRPPQHTESADNAEQDDAESLPSTAHTMEPCSLTVVSVHISLTCTTTPSLARRLVRL